MCGIHGSITSNKNNTKLDDFIRDAFTANSLRGVDASGIASIDTEKKREPSIHKLPVPGPFFATDKYGAGLIRLANLTKHVTIGHVRSSTSGFMGGVSDAHPFSIVSEDGTREIIGCHNGSLTFWKNKKNAKDYDVDSEWALSRIFDLGIEAFKDFEGSYVFVWWDSEDPQILNIALNDQRPMCIAFTDTDAMLYASEGQMLSWIAARTGNNLDGPVRRLVPHNWYKFKVGDLKNYTKEALPKSTVVTTTTWRAGSTKNVVEKVTELLAKISNTEAGGETTVVVARKATTTPKEVLEAKTAGLMNKKGIFSAYYYDNETQTMTGMVKFENGLELEGRIRNAKYLEDVKESEYNTMCIGIYQEGKENVAVCSHPDKKELNRGNVPLHLVN